MLLSTPGLVLHTTPYGEASVVAKVFTRQLGVRSYLVKGVRTAKGRVKQNLLQPLSAIDMVVYDNTKQELNYIKELASRRPVPPADAVGNALRFFTTEVLYRALREEEPLPDLFDYVDEAAGCMTDSASHPRSHLPINFLLTVARHLGIEPLDNYTVREPLFDLQEGRYVGVPTETTLPPALSALLHEYLSSSSFPPSTLNERRSLIDALIAYYQMHLSGFHNFHSHEILHTILK